MFTLYMELKEDTRIRIENLMSDWFNDCIEFKSSEVSLCEGEYKAYITYDGNNNKPNVGTCTFKFNEVGDKIEGFEITNVTGGHFLPFSEQLQTVLRG